MTINQFLQSGSAMGCFIIGLFFLKFWRRTGDRMFTYFALSFWLEAMNRTLLAHSQYDRDDELLAFVLRLISYCLILIAIWDKNRKPGDQPGQD